ncbi:hypothetical protein JCM8547_002825 [Rhodosporidiobolus lusitaniae]
MGKREAESQLTQNNWEQEDEGQEGNSGDFKKADERALAGRKIRGLPKRKGAAAPAPAAPAPDAAPKPTPFAGFGAPAAASPNPFAALSATPAPAAPAASPFSFGAAAPKPATNGAAAPAFSFGTTSSFSAPSASSPSAPAAPSFSFGASSSTPSTSVLGAPAKPAAPAASTSSGSGQAAALKYYTALRALNLSLVDALNSEIEKDPFTDLSAGVFDKLKSKYAEHRSKVQKEYDAAEGKKTDAMEVDTKKSDIRGPTVPANEIPDIFKNPPKPVPIADLTEEKKDAEDDGIPAIFKNPPKPVPIADLSETGAGASDIPDIFKNPPKPVPIADLTPKEDEKKAAPPTPPAAFSFAGSAVKPSSMSSPAAPVSGGFVFKADAPADPYAEKSKFSFPVAPPTTSSSPSSTSSSTGSGKDDRAALKPPSAPKLAPAKLTNPPAKPSPLRFGQSVSPPTSPEKAAQEEAAKKKAAAAAPAAGGFSFASSFGKIAKGEEEKKDGEGEKKEKEGKKSKVPAFGAPAASATGAFSFPPSATTSSSTPAAPPFSFGASSSSSTSSSTPSKPLFGAAPTPFSTPSSSLSSSTSGFKPPAAASPPIATSFGASSPPTFGFGAALQGKDKDKALGATAGAARNTGFAFGSSIGGSSGFSFGAAAPANKDEPAKVTTGFSFGGDATGSPAFGAAAAPAASSSLTTPAFSFAPSASTSTSPSSIPPAASRTASIAPSDASEAPSAADGSQTPGGNPFAAPGEGEEGETVLHAARGKVWRIKGAEQELAGIANVQLKERQEGGKGKVRMLARNETNGAVLINFSLHAGLTIKVEKVFATFTGFDDQAKPVIYRLRFKTPEMVKEFEEAVEEAKAKLA